MRLIDADAYAASIMQVWDKAEKLGRQDIVSVLADIVTPCLVGTPTAYDVDKVVEELERYKELMKDNMNNATDSVSTNYYRGRWNAAIDSIETVKRGGV